MDEETDGETDVSTFEMPQTNQDNLVVGNPVCCTCTNNWFPKLWTTWKSPTTGTTPDMVTYDSAANAVPEKRVAVGGGGGSPFDDNRWIN